MSASADALRILAAQLRDEDSPISPHVTEPTETTAAGEYAVVVEAVREGYLLHYGEPRLLAGQDDDLALLAGDYLYALGIERLAALGDIAAVKRLADLIATSAQFHTEGREADLPAVWRESIQIITSS